jgi:glycosyltransferase involved in cell wall biosynthesis
LALPVLPQKPLALPLRLAVVSRLAPNKRIDHAIRTVKSLGELGIETRLTIVGAGEVESQLHRLVDELKLTAQIAFTGPLPEAQKDEQLRDAHFLLHTSLREGWGLNVIEANANGTPGAVYPVAGLTESTLHDQTGIIAEKETPESLAAALAAVLKTPEKYERYRIAAWNRAKSLHWDKVLPPACDWLEAQARGRKNNSG